LALAIEHLDLSEIEAAYAGEAALEGARRPYVCARLLMLPEASFACLSDSRCDL